VQGRLPDYLARIRQTTPATGKLLAPAPFPPTGWKTVWLDHLSFQVTNYKASASFYGNLLGWRSTYDEGSQNELMIGDIGEIIIRGGNPNDPDLGKSSATPVHSARLDHISFGISPWDTDGVKMELEKRHLEASVDTSTADDIHVAHYKSYHTTTPNGYDLQVSYVTRQTAWLCRKPSSPDLRLITSLTAEECAFSKLIAPKALAVLVTPAKSSFVDGAHDTAQG
jgi:catechol 2,3-dioxygenase-like lactoylglutathione lyase family enzyme